MADEEIKVDFLFPKSYAKACLSTMKLQTELAILECMWAIADGKQEAKFFLPEILVLQIIVLRDVLKKHGAILEYEWGEKDGIKGALCRADVRGLIDKI